ncbi:MAG: hypothetical protein RLZZ553_1081 [Verrucomicrobiota bacterium]
MKHLWMALSFLLAVSSCSKKSQPAMDAAAQAQKASDLASEVRELEQQQEKLRREIELEKLAMEREELRIQREALATKGQRLSEEELALEKQKNDLAKQRAEDATAHTLEPSTKTSSQQAATTPIRPAPSLSASASAMGDYDYSIFYNRLEGDGTWFQSPDYGYVWRPKIVAQNHDWRPYTIGRWAYTDCGWTWISSESFGWATYHYGRWALLRNSGWCWIPGNQWAPAWVCWKSSADYVGWAPLPPESLYWRGDDWNRYYGNASGISPRCFNFVRLNGFGGSIVNVVLSVSDCVSVYRQTNYCGGYRWDQRRVHCEGVSYDAISRVVSTPLPRYQCDFDARPPTNLDPLRYVATRGDRLNIHAPNFNVPWNGALRPTVLESKPLQDEIIRDPEVAAELRGRFIEARALETRQAEASMRTGLAQKISQRIVLEEKIQAQRVELAASLKSVALESSASDSSVANSSGNSPVTNQVMTPEVDGNPANPKPLSHERDVAIDRISPTLPPNSETRDNTRPGMPKPEALVSRKSGETDEGIGDSAQPESPNLGSIDDPALVRPASEPAEVAPSGMPAADRSVRPRIAQREQGEVMSNPLRRRQEQAAEKEQTHQREQQSAMLQQQRELAEERSRRMQQEQMQKQQAEDAQKAAVMRDAEEKAQMQQMRQEAVSEARELAEAQKQQEAMREEQEAARQKQMRQQQEAMREEQEAARQEQMRQQQEAMREEQEAARQEQVRQQQEAMREAQEAARQEQMRQQQEAMREEQEAARQEQMRQQQEAMREAQEAARQEQMRQQQEAMREAQEAARQEQMRQQQEAQQRSRQEEMRQQQDSGRDADSGGGLRRFR